MSSSETNARVVPIGDPDRPALRLAYNRAFRQGRALPLLPRLEQAVGKIAAAAPSSKWLTGNRRFLQESSVDLRRALVSIAKELLPLSADGPLLGFPRIFEIAVTLVDLTPADLSPDVVGPFLAAFQSVHSLIMAELWALDTMLRLALLEALACASTEAMPALVSSLKNVQSASWQDFFEANSRTEQILRKDPTGDYTRMDFATRDQYRHAVERIARYSEASEQAVAQAAIDLAVEAGRTQNAQRSGSLREQHVGFHLIDRGAARLKAGLQFRPDLRTQICDTLLEWPTAFYLVGIELCTLGLAAWLLSLLPSHLGYLGLIVFLLATEPAIAFANALVTYLLPPRQLPKLDFSEGIPADCVTMAVVPTLLLSEAFVAKLLRDLEVRFLANRDPRLSFALLTDFPDATKPTDELDHLAEQCAQGVSRLNERYGTPEHQPFYLFHRRREWNPKQATWMGLERKRGKLIALNQLLRGVEDAFHVKVGDLSVLSQIRFIITLDSDTEMPRGAAQQLAGTLAHPLNRAVIDPHWNIVREGYGILQPRVGISIDSARRTRLAALYSGQTGYDLYSTAVSDVYQDLFGEGSYVGKGIYDVDVFQQTLAQRFPHDLLLSHDLIEGTYARAGLVSDIELIDDYPSHYSAWSKRKHRWTRGDWQIMLWLLPRVPDYKGKLVPNPLSVISLWKIADNLRRSLLEIAVFVLLLAGWTVLPGGPIYWTSVVALVTILPVYIGVFFSLLRLPFDDNWRTHLADTARGFLSGHVEAAFRLIFLPHQACIMLDAILRSIVRTTMTGRRLLEWESAAQAELGKRKVSRVDTFLWLSIPISVVAAAAVAYLNPSGLKPALPFLLAWSLSPVIALWLNAPLIPRKDRLRPQDRRFLRGVALRTWQFFDEYATAEHNWLVPDNVREEDGCRARRISPTNLGLLLNSHLAAADFGFVSPEQLVENIARIFAAMRCMARVRGHFVNWYDTDSLAPLAPRYVSTVDSGNLAAALIALRQGLLEQVTRPAFNPSVAESAADYARILIDLGVLGEQLAMCCAPAPASAEDWREWFDGALAEAQTVYEHSASEEQQFWAARLRRMLESHRAWAFCDSVPTLRQQIATLAQQAEQWVSEMDFSFLLKPKRKLFHTGWNADSGELDNYEYDLLASESRTASLIAIAKNDVPHTHWARLGRRVVKSAGNPVLLSWSGTMFEYLMPNLWMRRYADTLLDQSASAAVRCQQRYGRMLNIPWGVSECAAAERINGEDHRYYAFGVPDLAANPEQDRACVIAPYASLLALAVEPRRAIRNLEEQARRGWLARYGFYESADFADGSQETLVKVFMAHHHGMSLVALDNLLNEGCMQERFHREPMIEATALLLHERAARRATARLRDNAITSRGLRVGRARSAA